jgi:hypothetical protein
MMTEEKSSKSTGLRIEQTHRDAENRMERGGGEELSGGTEVAAAAAAASACVF